MLLTAMKKHFFMATLDMVWIMPYAFNFFGRRFAEKTT